ncbi:unnamed protein product [Effrenium voratum]|nr:unnamed protein product [Effrenium voratum]
MENAVHQVPEAAPAKEKGSSPSSSSKLAKKLRASPARSQENPNIWKRLQLRGTLRGEVEDLLPPEPSSSSQPGFTITDMLRRPASPLNTDSRDIGAADIPSRSCEDVHEVFAQVARSARALSREGNEEEVASAASTVADESNEEAVVPADLDSRPDSVGERQEDAPAQSGEATASGSIRLAALLQGSADTSPKRPQELYLPMSASFSMTLIGLLSSFPRSLLSTNKRRS